MPCAVLLLFCAIAPQLRAVSADDVLIVTTLRSAPVLDGRIADGEYGEGRVPIRTAAGDVLVRVGRHGGYVHVAAEMPDSTFYWGDDLVISLDVDGSGGATPSAGDRQWYLRRLMDSSVVVVAPGEGRWSAAGSEPSRLGSARRGDVWEVATQSGERAWTIEMRIEEDLFRQTGNASRIAFRTFNDDPRGWWSWPGPPEGIPAFRVEQVPDLWIPVRFDDASEASRRAEASSVLFALRDADRLNQYVRVVIDGSDVVQGRISASGSEQFRVHGRRFEAAAVDSLFIRQQSGVGTGAVLAGAGIGALGALLVTVVAVYAGLPIGPQTSEAAVLGAGAVVGALVGGIAATASADETWARSWPDR